MSQYYDIFVFDQWDLVCDRNYFSDTSQAVLAFGVLVGAMLFTTLSDNFGRKPIFLFR